MTQIITDFADLPNHTVFWILQYIQENEPSCFTIVSNESFQKNHNFTKTKTLENKLPENLVSFFNNIPDGAVVVDAGWDIVGPFSDIGKLHEYSIKGGRVKSADELDPKDFSNVFVDKYGCIKRYPETKRLDCHISDDLHTLIKGNPLVQKYWEYSGRAYVDLVLSAPFTETWQEDIENQERQASELIKQIEALPKTGADTKPITSDGGSGLVLAVFCVVSVLALFLVIASQCK